MVAKVTTKMVKFRIRRYNPETGKIWWQEYRVEVKKGLTVLEALLNIKAEQDNSLTFRYSCRMGACGSCGMLINKTPRLACETQVSELGTDTITIEPLPNYPVLRDLMTDFTDFFKKHRQIMPYLIRKDKEENENPIREYIMKIPELDNILRFSYCIMCGLCYAACPVVAIDKKFLGPQALSQAYRWIADVRDEGVNLRLEKVDTRHGVWRCHFAGSCSAVCPKGVDPAQGIQLLRSKIISFVGQEREVKGSQVTPPKVLKPSLPKPAPEPTIEDIDILIKQLEEAAKNIESDLPTVAEAVRSYVRKLVQA